MHDIETEIFVNIVGYAWGQWGAHVLRGSDGLLYATRWNTEGDTWDQEDGYFIHESATFAPASGGEDYVTLDNDMAYLALTQVSDIEALFDEWLDLGFPTTLLEHFCILQARGFFAARTPIDQQDTSFVEVARAMSRGVLDDVVRLDSQSRLYLERRSGEPFSGIVTAPLVSEDWGARKPKPKAGIRGVVARLCNRRQPASHE